MPYKQIAYNEKVGNGPYTIAQIGCFVTAFCNLLERNSQAVDPPTLNNFFNSHNVYLNDPGDGKGVKDDLFWNSITNFNPHLVVTGTGTGWPSSNNAIVKFFYRGKSGAWETHFCLVADHAAQTIVDSYDGTVKHSGIYGTPVGYATYSTPTVQPVVTAVNPPVVVNHPTTPPPQVNEIFLPSAAGTWRVYNVAGPYSSAPVDHSIHKLVPGAFPPGLTYQVLQALAPHVYEIQTQDYGKVAIYVGPDTIAQFPNGGHGEGEAVDQVVTDVSQGEQVPVHVGKWQDTYTVFLTPQKYIANTSALVYNLDEENNQGDVVDLKKGMLVDVAGTFSRDGVKYYRTVNSAINNKWYGIPVTALAKPTTDDDIGDIVNELKLDVKKTKGFLSRIRR